LGPGHYHLWKLDLHHRDISIGNLMYWRDENGDAYGTLSDYDLSSRRGVPSNNKQRTGTLPFMAIELLSASGPIVHKYEHDVESFYWVLLYAILCAKDGRLDCPMRDWGNLEMEALREKKNDYIMTSRSNHKYQPVPARQKNFDRSRGVRSAVIAQIKAQEPVETWDSEPDQQPGTAALDVDDVDKVYNTLEDARRQGVEAYPLDKIRPEFPGRS
jgi:Fungal protein kinase